MSYRDHLENSKYALLFTLRLRSNSSIVRQQSYEACYCAYLAADL